MRFELRLTKSTLKMSLWAAASFGLVVVMNGAPVMAQQIPQGKVVENRALPDFLEQLFPRFFKKDDTGPKPEDTLVAPFADGAAAVDTQAEPDSQGEAITLPSYDEGKASSDLSMLHRSEKDIAAWLVRATSEIFTLDSRNYRNHLSHLGTGMTPAGLAEFNKFLNDTNIYSKLQSDDLLLKTYVEEEPTLLNEGAVAGRYRWLFEMPVTITFVPRNASGYAGTDPEKNSLRLIVQTQLGRVEKGPSEENVMIETWRIRAPAGGKTELAN
jgi:hypothetical protein